MFSKQYRKVITVEDNKKRMNITNLYKYMQIYKYISIYMQIYITILYLTKITRNKNDSINSFY